MSTNLIPHLEPSYPSSATEYRYLPKEYLELLFKDHIEDDGLVIETEAVHRRDTSDVGPTVFFGGYLLNVVEVVRDGKVRLKLYGYVPPVVPVAEQCSTLDDEIQSYYAHLQHSQKSVEESLGSGTIQLSQDEYKGLVDGD